MNFGQRAGRRGRRRRWAGARVRRNSFRHGAGQAMGRRKSSPKFISAWVRTGDGQAQEFAEIHFGTGLGRRWAGARVRRNSFRHGSGQAMGRRKSSPKFISAWVRTGDGQAQEFAEIHFGTGLGRRWETEMNFGQRAGRRGRRRRWEAARVRRNSFRHGSGQAMGRRKSSPKFISARVWTGDGQAQEFAEIHFGMGLGRRWAGARVRRNSFRHGSAQAMGRRKSSPKFISARVWTGDGQPQEFAEIHFGMGLGRRWAGARVRRNSFRHGAGQAMGRRKSSPKFISARGWTGDGQAQEFAEIHFGTGLDRRWAGARVRRNSFRHGSGQAMGDRNEFRSTGRAPGSAQAMGDRNEFRSTGRAPGSAQAMGNRNECRSTGRAPGSGQAMGDRNECRSTGRAPGSGQAMGDRNEFRSTGRAPGSGQAMGDRNEFRSTGRAPGSGQTMGNRKSSPKFISAWVWTGDGRPK
jgi:hypothetical protein